MVIGSTGAQPDQIRPSHRTMLERLFGVPCERAVVPHVDDLGASHGANRAFLELAARGLVTGGTARYRLYPTADGGMIAAAPIEDRFWAVFCEAIGLDAALRDDTNDPAATVAGVAALISGRGTEAWRTVFARAADCCCCPVASLQEAMQNPHFLARGLFTSGVVSANGQRMSALPMPIDPAFRGPTGDRPAPALGADTDAVLG